MELELDGSVVMTVAELGAALSLSETTIRRLCASEKIPSFKVGGSVRIPARFIADLLQERAAV
jgi:excisionase family DNA binding protein